MDVLRPNVVWIGNRCYRKNAVAVTDDETPRGDVVLDTIEDAYGDEVCDAFTNVEETEDGYRIKLSIPEYYFKFIIGKKAETKKRLENETRTQIVVPKQGVEGDVVIKGRERRGVLSAKTRIDLLVDSARQRAPFTHFLSFPVAGEVFKDRFEIFKSGVLQECRGDRGLDSSIFQNPLKLHLTVGTLVLMNEAEIQHAVDILKQCQEEIIRPIMREEPLLVQFSGLEYMNDDPSEVDVLYVKSKDPSDRLQQLADRLVDRFTLANIMQKDYDRVKLHVTVMNTLFRKDPSGTQAPQGKQAKGSLKDRESFNANAVLEKFGDFEFGQHHIDSLHLSQRYSTSAQGYYECETSVPL